jgi:hypothetical protein
VEWNQGQWGRLGGERAGRTGGGVTKAGERKRVRDEDHRAKWDRRKAMKDGLRG